VPAALPLLSAAFAAGIALAARIAPPMAFLVIPGAAAALTSWIMLRIKRPAAAAAGLILFFLLAGSICGRLAVREVRQPWAPLLGRQVILEGYVRDVLQQEAGYTAFLFYAETVEDSHQASRVGGLARVSLYGEGVQLGYGDRLRLRCTPAAPAGRRNPGGFDYAAYLESIGAGAVITIRLRDMDVLPGRGGNTVAFTARKLQERAARVIDTHLPAREAGLASGLLLGEREAVADDTLDAYRRLGLAHLLAVSGLHVGFVAAFALFAAGKILRGRNPAIPALAAVCLVMAYVFLTGGRPPVWRAAITMALGLAAVGAGRERDGLQGLAAAMLLMLFFRPLWLFGLSFQFSFLATAGILLAAPRIEPLLTRLPRRIAGLLAVTLAAQLAVLPLQAAHFGLISWLAVPLNLVCVPLVGMAMVLGLAGLMAGFVWIPLAAPFFGLARPVLAVLERLPRIPASWPLASFELPAYSLPVWLAVWLMAALALNAVRERRLNTGQLLTLLLAANLLIFSGLPATGRSRLAVTFLDVGQGMAVHVRTPAGGHLLIDAGGRAGFDTGSRIILPYLRASGARQLDLMILTHPHFDHYGGMASLAQRLPVRAFICNGESDESETFSLLRETLIHSGTATYAVEAGYSFTLDGIAFAVLSPPAQRFSATGDDVNNNSLVLQMRYGDFTLMITGDAESEAISRLLREGHQIDAFVLQVPHHGSRGALSPDFLAAAGTRIAVIPVGPNTFGHPHPDTLTLLAGQNIAIYRTDLHGAVTISSCGKTWHVETVAIPVLDLAE
jgi:competence protein ComEC